MKLLFYSFVICLCVACSTFGKKEEEKSTKSKRAIRNIEKSQAQQFKNIPKIKIKTFVFDFFNNSIYNKEEIGADVAEELRRLFEKSKSTFVLAPSDIKGLKDKKPSEVDIQKAIDEIKLYDARVFGYGTIDYIKLTKTLGEVGVFRDEQTDIELKITLRFVEIATGRILFEKSLTATDSKTRTVMFEEAKADTLDKDFIIVTAKNIFNQIFEDLDDAIAKLNWSGRIARVEGEKVYINSGRKSGLAIGDILKVVEIGEEIIDPQTGNILGLAPGRVKGTIEIKAFFGEDASIGIIHTGGGFVIGDRVELY